MADIKISQLGAAIAVNDSDLLPIVSNGNTLKAPASLVKNYAVGNTDLSGIGDGTPTGAIAALNTELGTTKQALTTKLDESAVTDIIETLGNTPLKSGGYKLGDLFMASDGNMYKAYDTITSSTTIVAGVNGNCRQSNYNYEISSIRNLRISGVITGSGITDESNRHHLTNYNNQWKLVYIEATYGSSRFLTIPFTANYNEGNLKYYHLCGYFDRYTLDLAGYTFFEPGYFWVVVGIGGDQVFIVDGTNGAGNWKIEILFR